MKRRSVLAGIAAAAAVPAIGGCSSGSSSTSASGTQLAAQSGHILEATAITEVFGDGQKLTAVAVKYDAAIDTSKLTRSTFKVTDRTVTNVYANTEAATAGHGINGVYVVIELSPLDEAARLYEDHFSGSSSSSSPSPSPSQSSASPSGSPSGGPGGGGGA
ncbi:hypothetical protein ACRAWF_39515 [Streptomyces sp. L7]